MLFFLTRPPDFDTGSHHLSDPHPAVFHYASVPLQVSRIHNIQYDIFFFIVTNKSSNIL